MLNIFLALEASSGFGFRGVRGPGLKSSNLLDLPVIHPGWLKIQYHATFFHAFFPVQWTKKQASPKRNEPSLSIQVYGLFGWKALQNENQLGSELCISRDVHAYLKMLNTFPHQKSRDQKKTVNLPKTQCRVWFLQFVYLYQVYLYHIISWIKQPLNIFPWCERHSQLLRYLEGHYKSHMIWSYLHHVDDMLGIFHLFFWDKKIYYSMSVCLYINTLPTNVASQMSYLVYLDTQYPKRLQVYKGGAMARAKLIPLEAEHGGPPWKRS